VRHMNINDVPDVPKTNNKLEAIYIRQMGLADKYKEIEGLPWPWPLHPDIAENQIWFKDFLWRVTEELVESLEAALNKDQVHQIEELSDSLHFLIELLLMVGISIDEIRDKSFYTSMGIVTSPEDDVLDFIWSRLPSPEDSDMLLEFYWDVVYHLGLAGNCLKNKKWKQTQMPTDVNKFRNLLIHSFRSLIALFKVCGCSSDEIYIYYYKKSEVNKFRQRTHY